MLKIKQMLLRDEDVFIHMIFCLNNYATEYIDANILCQHNKSTTVHQFIIMLLAISSW